MPPQQWIFHERPDSGDFTTEPDTFVKKYVCGRHGDEAYVKAYALLATPLIFNGLYRQTVKAKHIGGGLFNLDVTYGKNPPPDIDAYRIRYDTTGGTAHITQAKEHLDDYGPPGPPDPPDHGGAINVKDDGRPEGTEIVVSAFRWSQEHTLPISIAGWPYSQVLKALTGKVNEEEFRGFPIGQVLFKGATGSYSSALEDAHKIQLVYNFEQNDNITNITYDKVEGVTKVGWEYLWFEHAQEDDDNAKRLKSPLIAVHRERVYDAADFTLLLLPGD